MRFTYQRLGLAVPIAVALLFVVTTVGSAEIQQAIVDSTRPYFRPVAEARFDGWRYTLVADPDGSGATQATVEYDHATVADLKRYVQTNRALAHQLAASGLQILDVTVSFHRPLSIDEFRAWATDTTVVVERFQLRVVGANGRRWTLGGAPSDGQLVSATALRRNLDRLAARGASDVRGFIVAEGSVAASAYDSLADHPAVFLADVTRSAAADQIARTVQGLDPSRLTVGVMPAFAAMEDLGLEHFE